MATPPRTRYWLVLVLAVACSAPCLAQTADYYVATNGSDAWSGTLPAPNGNRTDGPFATIPRAQTAVQQLLKNLQGRSTPIVVMLRNGTYFQSSSLSFGTLDSGTSNVQVFWENYPSETPVISGGIQIKHWTAAGSGKWTATMPAKAQNFEQLFYNGQRRLRPRLGTTSGSTIGSYYRILATVFLNSPGPPNPAPDPNCSAYVTGSGWQCFDRFQYNPSDPISNTWENLAPPAGNHCHQSSGNPNLVGDIELLDFEFFTVSKLRISCVDTIHQIVYLTGPTQNNPSVVHGFFPNHRYVVENIKDELTQPGQWFLDRSTTPWTLTYMTQSGENPNTDVVIVPQAAQVLVASQLQYVTFLGITFENDNYVVPAAGYQSSHGDPGIPTAVSCQNCSNVTFDTDIVTQTSGGGLEFVSCLNTFSPTWCTTLNSQGSTANNSLVNSALYDIGAMGLRVGIYSVYTDTDANVPQFTTVQNNVIEGVGRVFPSSFGVMQGTGHDNLYTHNDVYDSYHSAIAICGYGCPPGQSNSKGTFNNTISFNHVYNLMQGILNDTGALYFNTGNGIFTPTGNQALNNKVHDVTDAHVLDADGYGGHGIDLDADTASVNIQNNLIYRVSASNVWETCGPQLVNQANTIRNNILAFSEKGAQGIGCAAPLPNLSQFNMSHNLIYFQDPATVQNQCAYCVGGNCVGTQRYSKNMYCDAANASCKLTTTPFYTTDVSCIAQTPLTWSAWKALGEDAGSMVKNPLFVSPNYPSDNFELQTGTPAGEVGFVAFDVNAPGRTSDSIIAPAIAPTFVTAAMSAKTTVTLTSSVNSPAYGQNVTFTSMLSSGIGPPPDGDTVTFSDGSTTLGTVSVAQGAAQYSTATLGGGNHNIKASFNGGVYWATANAPTLRMTVSQATPIITLQASPNPSSYRQSVTLTANVSGSSGVPTGNVQFLAGSQPLGTSALSNGVATVTTSTLQGGTSSLTAVYKGDKNFLGVTSAPLNQVVDGAATTTTLTAKPNPSNSGQNVTFDAMVSASAGGTPTGTVTFYSGTTQLGQVTLKGGKATLSTSFQSGSYKIKASYGGSSNYAASSGKLVQTVN